ncbi:MAG: PHP domain-containing protein [bacterium]
MFIDLHIHTNYSDGAFSPEQTVEHAYKIGLGAISIVDHDTTDGLDQAIRIGEKNYLEVVPGIELSADALDSKCQEVHILGYFINWKQQAFQNKLTTIREARWLRAKKILKKLGKLGLNLSMEDILQYSNIQSVGRLHVAKALMNKKLTKNVREAFDKFLSPGRPAYEPKLRVTPQEAINDILSLGGLPVLAHPLYCIEKDELLLKKLVSYGLEGIEVWHPKHNRNSRQYFKDLAQKYNLVSTGGSDCHGPIFNRGPFMGSQHVPYKCLEDLQNRLEKKNLT